ncbi:MAG: GPP34 family phosphoprotein [Mycobacteriales bacterium]
MLLAEKFVMLALNADGSLARGAGNHAAAAVGVTAALVTELAQQGHVDLTDGRITLTGSRPEHPLLAQALDNLAPHEGKKLKSRLGAVRHSGWREVVDGMIDAGIVGREKSPLQSTRHPVADPAAHAALLADVRAAAVGDGPMDPDIACLLALAGPSQHLEVVAPNRGDRGAARRRIDEAAESVPAAAAVKYVVEAAAAAAATGIA